MYYLKTNKKNLSFASTYVCETVFSVLKVMQNKYRTKLNAEPDSRVVVSNIKPDMETIISKIQVQVSL